jgi:hypothetical protein
VATSCWPPRAALAERLAAAALATMANKPNRTYRHALREVMARCIFGVDRNPMAMELARTALWLEGFEEGRPLGFWTTTCNGATRCWA